MSEETQPDISSPMSSVNKRGRTESKPIEIHDSSDKDDLEEQPPHKKRCTTRQGTEQDLEEHEDGEVANVSSHNSSRAASSPPKSPGPAHSGWNEGVKPTGLRISFGTKTMGSAQKTVMVPTSREPESSAEEADHGQEVTAAEAAGMTRRQSKEQPPPDRQGDDTSVKGEEHQQIVSQPSNGASGRPTRAAKKAAAAAITEEIAHGPATKREIKPVFSQSGNRIFSHNHRKWQQPEPPGSTWASRGGKWLEKFKKWLTAFVTVNKNKRLSHYYLNDIEEFQRFLIAAYINWHGNRDVKKKAAAPIRRFKQEGKLAEVLTAIEHDVFGSGGDQVPAQSLDPAANRIAPASPSSVMSPNPAEPKSSAEAVSESSSPSGKSSGEISEDSEPRLDEAMGVAEAKTIPNGVWCVSCGLLGDDSASGHCEGCGTSISDASVKAYRERYYPGILDHQVFCTKCTSFDHWSQACPEMVCSFCFGSNHMTVGCPSRQRCSRCKQLGHAINDCREKLALAPGEGLECAFCASKEHTESDCTEFFRTIQLSNKMRSRKVKRIPIFCYCCGKEGHYGTECGLHPPQIKTAAIEIWSKENWQLHVDPVSTLEAVAWSSTPRAEAYANDAHGRPDLGKPLGSSYHSHFVEPDSDDDDEEDFIRPPVQRPQQNGQINVSRQGRGGFSSLAQQVSSNPPLPPGPPPGLPAKPPQASDQKRGNRKPKGNRQGNQGRNNGQQNGRGGGGGGAGGGFRIRGGATRGGRGGRR